MTHDSSCQAHVLIFGAPGDREGDRQLILARLLAGFLTASFCLIFIARGVYDRLVGSILEASLYSY